MRRKLARHIPVYRPLFVRALKTAWEHKSFWFVGIFAGLAGTGVVVNDLLAQARAFASIAQNGLAHNSLIVQIFLTYADSVTLRGGSSPFVAIGLFAVLLLAVAFLVVFCQQLLLLALVRSQKRASFLHPFRLFPHVRHFHFFRILAIDALFHVLVLNIMIGASYALARLATGVVFLDVTLGVALTAAALALAFFLSIVAMLMLVSVVRDDANIIAAWYGAIAKLENNTLVAFEVSASLFTVNLFASVVYFLLLAAVALPFYGITHAAFDSGSFPLLVIGTIGGGIAGILFTLAYGGFVTTFTYAAWVNLAETLERAPFLPRIHAYTARLRSHLGSR